MASNLHSAQVNDASLDFACTSNCRMWPFALCLEKLWLVNTQIRLHSKAVQPVSGFSKKHAQQGRQGVSSSMKLYGHCTCVTPDTIRNYPTAKDALKADLGWALRLFHMGCLYQLSAKPSTPLLTRVFASNASRARLADAAIESAYQSYAWQYSWRRLCAQAHQCMPACLVRTLQADLVHG